MRFFAIRHVGDGTCFEALIRIKCREEADVQGSRPILAQNGGFTDLRTVPKDTLTSLLEGLQIGES